MDHTEALNLDQINAIANGHYEQLPLLSQVQEKNIFENHSFLNKKIMDGHPIYGITTGLGSSSKNKIDIDLSNKLQANLIAYHGCGLGPVLPEPICAAALLLRIMSLSQGSSGVRLELITHLKSMLKNRVIPAIPSRGSVGASGDLTPLSYIAAAAKGDRQCYYKGRLEPSQVALKQAGLEAIEFQGREPLAIMNGTSVMTAIASVAWKRVETLANTCCQWTALLVELVQGRTAPFVEEIHKCKPHAGQKKAAYEISQLLSNTYDRLQQGAEEGQLYHKNDAIQDVYSIRCSPQVIGVLFDALTWSRTLIETEANSVNDNPCFLHKKELILNGGNFFGGHIALACDNLKIALANCVNLAERQVSLIFEEKVTSFLSENLSLPGCQGEQSLRHGLKALHISMSAITAEIIKNAQAMSLYSRPTEASNQDVVSMGTTAAMDLLKLSQLSESALSIMSMTITQGFYIAKHRGYSVRLNDKAAQLLKQTQAIFPVVSDDRMLEHDITKVSLQLFGEPLMPQL